jgi:methylated-DNA-protein-cysteine methyltransferase related protein
MPNMFQAILAQIRRIPKGKVATYGDVAYAAGYPGAARQVVWALHSSRGLPWQRVVGAGGKILLTGEHGFEQRLRLQQEGVHFNGQRIAIDEHRFQFFGRNGARVTARKDQSAKKTSAKKKTANTKKQATRSSANAKFKSR